MQTYVPYTMTVEKMKRIFHALLKNKMTAEEREVGIKILLNIAKKDRRINLLYKKSSTKINKEEWIKNFLKGGDKDEVSRR